MSKLSYIYQGVASFFFENVVKSTIMLGFCQRLLTKRPSAMETLNEIEEKFKLPKPTWFDEEGEEWSLINKLF